MDSGTQGRARHPGGAKSLTQEAIVRAKAGDREGLHYLYVRYAEDVSRCVAGLVPDRQKAEDITQNVFIEMMSAIKNYEERDVPFDAWILGVARSAALDHRR
jgi:DNA-directed RNA polymerase specialized sigma24 family protein